MARHVIHGIIGCLKEKRSTEGCSKLKFEIKVRN